MSGTLKGRALNEAIRVAVIANLDAEAPCPRTTPELQACFSTRNRQRVYTALRWAEEQGHVLCYRELMGCWWVSALEPPHCQYPDCTNMAARVLYTLQHSTARSWYHTGGYSCSRREHCSHVSQQPWPWLPDLTSVAPRSAWSESVDA
jgi:hypothetical protein